MTPLARRRAANRRAAEARTRVVVDAPPPTAVIADAPAPIRSYPRTSEEWRDYAAQILAERAARPEPPAPAMSDSERELEILRARLAEMVYRRGR